MFFIEKIKKSLNLFNEETLEKTKRLPVKLKSKQKEEIIIPEGVKVIDAYMFMDFKNLKRIVLPSTTKIIGDAAFANCTSLEEIIIPDKVESIGNNCFYNCRSLKNVKCGSSLKHIGYSSFKDCTSLNKITFTSDETYLKEGALENCENVFIHNNTSETLLEYVNKISKKKYNSLEELSKENKQLKDIINYISLIPYQGERKYNIKKFQELFFKTRAKDMISFNEFKHLTLEQTKNFDYKLYKEIKKYTGTIDNPIEFINFMSIFGLFEDDKDIEKRKDLFIKLLKNNKCYITLENKNKIKEFLENFELITKYEYVLDENYKIPNEFSLYLDKIMPEEKVIKLKKVNGTFGAHLNRFIKNKYIKKEIKMLKLKDNIIDKERENICKLVYNNNINVGLNKNNISILFEDIDQSYNKKFFDFLINNLDTIFYEIKKLEDFCEIKENFNDIKRFYLKHGKENIDIYDAIKYNDVYKFKHACFGDEKFIKYLKDSGAQKDSFNFYKKQYKKIKSKYKTTLPNTNLTFSFNDEKIRIRRLPCNDPLQIFIGEVNYTDCCQMYNDLAENCIEGLAESTSMGVTIVELLKNNYSILLAQSLDWTRNGVYCHDNIEGSDFLNSNKEYQKIVLKAYEYQAKEIIEKSKTASVKYLEEKEKSLTEKEYKKLKDLIENQIIKVVVVGDNFSDVEVDDLKDLDPEINSVQSEYCCYSDAGFKKILCGDEEKINKEKLFAVDKQVEIFKEKRKVNTFDEINITEEEILKMSQIENQNNKTNLKNEYNKPFLSLCDKLKIESSKCKIILGEDWYIIYSVNENELIIHDLKNGTVRNKEEKLSQLIEIKNTLLNIIKEHNKSLNIKTYVDKKSTYPFYLNCIKKEIIKQNDIKEKNKDIYDVDFTITDKYVRKISSRK